MHKMVPIPLAGPRQCCFCRMQGEARDEAGFIIVLAVTPIACGAHGSSAEDFLIDHTRHCSGFLPDGFPLG